MVAAVIIARDKALEVGMIPEDIVRVDGLAAAGREAHLVQEHAGADRRERVAGEVEVGHRVDDQIVRRGDEILQRIRRSTAHLLERDALHGLFHERLALEVLNQIVVVLILPLLRFDVALGQPLIQKRLDKARMQPQHVGHEVLQINDLDAVVTQDLRKRVMLLLCDLQEGNVVKQQLAQTVRRQMQQLTARTMQKNFFQRVDLASNTNTFHSSSNHVLSYSGPASALWRCRYCFFHDRDHGSAPSADKEQLIFRRFFASRGLPLVR